MFGWGDVFSGWCAAVRCCNIRFWFVGLLRLVLGF